MDSLDEIIKAQNALRLACLHVSHARKYDLNKFIVELFETKQAAPSPIDVSDEDIAHQVGKELLNVLVERLAAFTMMSDDSPESVMEFIEHKVFTGYLCKAHSMRIFHIKAARMEIRHYEEKWGKK
jgi:hypothetical protein